MTAFIATWLGAIVKRAYAKNNNKVFYYKNIQFTLLQNSEVKNRDILVMKVTLYHTNESLGQKKP